MLILRVAQHELRDLSRDGRIRWGIVVIAGLLIAALLTGWTYQRTIAAQHDDAARRVRETWLTQPSKDPHSAAHYGSYAFKPYGPLTLFDSGINPYVGVAAFLEAHKQNDFQFRPVQDRTGLARLGQLTAAATLQHLVPLLIILLAFTRFAGEREDGTLRQLVATGVSPRVLAAGKVAGAVGALAIVVGPATAVGTIALGLTSGATSLVADLPRIGLMLVTYGTYFVIWIGLALAVSARVRRASHALAVLVAFWAVNACLVPRLATDAANARHPAPTAVAFASAVFRDTYAGLPMHDYNIRRAADLRERLFAQYGVSRVEDLPVNFRGIDYLEREEHANDMWDRHYRHLWAVFDAQARIQQYGAVVAPLVAVQTISMAVAGVDLGHHRHFATAAEAYRRELVRKMNEDLAYAGSSAKLGSYATSPALWAGVEPFHYERPSLAMSMRGLGFSAGVLAAWIVVSLFGLALSVRRLAVD